MLLDEIGSRLTAQGVCSTAPSSTGWRLCYRDPIPTPARVICVVPSGGFRQDGKAPIDRPTFQLLIRGSSQDGAALETKVNDAVRALNCFDGLLNGWYYADIQKQGDVLWLGRDENQRPLYSVNFWTVRSRTS